MDGVFHQVGKQHLHDCLSELNFRYSSRKETDAIELCRLWRARPERADAGELKAAKLGKVERNLKNSKTAKGQPAS
jgi:hypothetical protein